MNEQTDRRDIRDSIITALGSISADDFSGLALSLLGILGYQSQRTLHDQTGKVDDFINSFPAYLRGEANKRNTKSDEVLCNNIGHIRFLFQFTEDEIAASDNTQINMLFSEINEFDESWVKSFFFVVAELRGENYPRGEYARLTREINRRFAQPAVVLFKTSTNLLTLAFVHRREHKRDPERDVLGNVSLIREINPKRPHRAHLDILSELSLFECLLWMDAKKQKHNFDGLLAAWLDKLNTDKLNQKFYKELFDWFNRSVNESRFPTNEAKILSGEEHIIRLITRLLFVWFIKEKGLASDDLFNEAIISKLLVDYDRESGDSYYRAVLQNLFFATLNTEIDKRGFSKETNVTHRNFSLYRYQQEIRDHETLLALFAKTPFINGGLFDCLDSEEGIKEGGYRIDCFSDVHYKKFSIPNKLFFDDGGLFPLLNRYKFTVEENTPIDQEVALDPELLGRVFENLLAAYNPETRDTVRKQTGSYYTPRVVVDYMVDEALVVSLTEKVTPKDDDLDDWQGRLRYLLDYKDDFDGANELFEKEEAESLVKAIAELKVLDPAVGSGAFPMGILHKLTLVLQRIDPDNQRWAALQKEHAMVKTDEAFDTVNKQERDAELKEISEIFENYSGDFGRKLYLIQNSIFGVDIQPVACQIAKLRFFISLAIEQVPDLKADNFGIKPLPNLETNFVAANTLLSLGRPKQMIMGQDDNVIAWLEHKLNENREHHFHANNRSKKLACKKENKTLRYALATELKKVGFPSEAAEKIANWDAYAQNNKADWFDAEYMFGVSRGFDIVIGNPPYIKEYVNRQIFDGLRDSPYYKGKMDVWYMFACKGIDLLRDDGVLTFIAQNNWVTSYGASIMRNKVVKEAQILALIDFGDFKIFSAGIQTMIMMFRRNISNESYTFDHRLLSGDNLDFEDVESLLNKIENSKTRYETPVISRSKYKDKLLTFGNSEVELLLDKISSLATFRFNAKEVAQGIVAPQDTINRKSKKILGGQYHIGDGIFFLDQDEKDLLRLTEKEIELIKPLYTTQELHRFYGNADNKYWVIYTDSSFKNKRKIEDYPNIKAHLDKFQEVITSDNKPYGLHRSRDERFFQGEKIVAVRKCSYPTFTYANFDSYVSATFYIIKTERLNLKYLTGLLNSKLLAFWLRHRGKMQGTNYQIDKEPLLNIPIMIPKDSVQNRIANTVIDIITIHKSDNSTPQEKTIQNCEEEINQLIYEAYGFEKEEIAIVEKNI